MTDRKENASRRIKVTLYGKVVQTLDRYWPKQFHDERTKLNKLVNRLLKCVFIQMGLMDVGEWPDYPSLEV